MNPIQRIVSWFKVKASAPAPVSEQRIEPFVREKSELDVEARGLQIVATESRSWVPKHRRGTQNIRKIRKAVRWARASQQDGHDVLDFLSRRVWGLDAIARIDRGIGIKWTW